MQSRHESQDTWVLCLGAQIEQRKSKCTAYRSGKISQPHSDLPLLRLKPHSAGQLCAYAAPGSLVLATYFASKGNWHSASSSIRSDPHTKKGPTASCQREKKLQLSPVGKGCSRRLPVFPKGCATQAVTTVSWTSHHAADVGLTALLLAGVKC